MTFHVLCMMKQVASFFVILKEGIVVTIFHVASIEILCVFGPTIPD